MSVVGPLRSLHDGSPTGNEGPLQVLAGPILRRVERDRVCVWLATRQAVMGSLVVYRAGREAEGPVGEGRAESVELGQHLFVHLLTAHPDGAFPTAELLTYDLNVSSVGPSQQTMTLACLGPVSGTRALAYRGFSLPSFFLGDESLRLHVLHGSCRKPHGRGEDALACADELLEETSSDPRRRPSALFLTGDQIYADDVADGLITHVSQLGYDLVGHEEEIPGMPPVRSLAPGERKGWLHHQAAFTSPRAGNHLMTFGEFAAVYLLAFSDELWPSTATKLLEVAEARYPRMSRRARARLKHRLPDLDSARRALPAVRRVLANIPTYMIFDDHDVTDDWNLTSAWRERVSRSPAGRRIVANALAAFWAFQGWGNDPGLFDDEFKEVIGRHLGGVGDGYVGYAASFEELLWSFDRWSFSAPTRPPTVCLDTRTQRHYDSDEGGARLINSHGFDRVAELVQESGHDPGEPLLMVSATPVCGLELQERRQKYLVEQVGPYQIDFEAWHSNLHGLTDLMRFLTERLGLSRAIVLSGDVHYGLTVDVRFSVDDKTVHVAQVVSSGLKPSGTVAKDLLDLLGWLNRTHHERIGWASPPVPRRLARLESRFLRRRVNTDAWAKESGPVFLSPKMARDLGIGTAPTYRERRTYVEPHGPASTALVGENNIGSVVFADDVVIHRLLSRGRTTTLHEARIDLAPAQTRQRKETS